MGFPESHFYEQELRALDALAGYGDDAFLKVFYEHMGKSYLQPHEAALRSIFKTIRDTASPIFDKAQEARDVIHAHRRAAVKTSREQEVDKQHETD